jgi:acyl dehydratase
MPAANEYYLDDYKVGDRFSSHTVTVSADEIIAFGRLYDPQPFHTDIEAAKTSVFHGLAASGWHTAALTMRLFVESMHKPAGGLLGAGVEVLDWPLPVRPGDTLHIEGEVIAARQSRTKPTQGIVTVRALTINQNGDAVQIFQPKMIVPVRPAKSL